MPKGNAFIVHQPSTSSLSSVMKGQSKDGFLQQLRSSINCVRMVDSMDATMILDETIEESMSSSSSTSTEERKDITMTDDEDEDDDYEEEEEDISSWSTMQIKERLLDLLQSPQMMGTRQEFRLVEQYINTLEERYSYSPVQTLEFLNLAMTGEWQLLFSTNIATSSSASRFLRLRELSQTIQPQSKEGFIVNQATWDLAEDGNGTFTARGTFQVQCSYQIQSNGSARMGMQLEDHVLKLAKGSSVPSNVPGLVGYLHRSMPKELFDPNDHAMDTTFIDGTLRIVRLTGPRLEGVRDIFIRRI